MTDRAPEVARALVEGEIAFDRMPDLPRRIRERWPDLSHDEMARAVFIAIEIAMPPVFIDRAVSVAPAVMDMRRGEHELSDEGANVLARFNCRTRGVMLFGLKLVQRHDGVLDVSNVVNSGGRPNARGVKIEDGSLRAAILAAALVEFDGMAAAQDDMRRHRGRRSGGR